MYVTWETKKRRRTHQACLFMMEEKERGRKRKGPKGGREKRLLD